MQIRKERAAKIKGKVYWKWVLVVPATYIEALRWSDGTELAAEVKGNQLFIRPAFAKEETW